MVLMALMTWIAGNMYQKFSQLMEDELKFEALSGRIVHLDEVLTMSSRLGAATGDPQWEARYRILSPNWMNDPGNYRPGHWSFCEKGVEQTNVANRKLVALENPGLCPGETGPKGSSLGSPS